MSYLARQNFLHQPNWLKPFFDAAYPELDSPSFGMDDAGNHTIGATRTWNLVTPPVVATDRRLAVHALTSQHPMLTTQPPSEYAWPRTDACAATGAIPRAAYVDGVARRTRPQRVPDLYYDPTPTNTYLGLGWKQMRGFQPAQPEPWRPECLAPLLYRDS